MRLATLAIGVLALANSKLWASSKCWAWNGPGFFEEAAVRWCRDSGQYVKVDFGDTLSAKPFCHITGALSSDGTTTRDHLVQHR